MDNLEEIKKDDVKSHIKGWKPEIGEDYWFIDDWGTVMIASWNNTDEDNFRYNMNDVFKTEDIAKRYLKLINAINEKKYEFRKEELEDASIIKYDILHIPKDEAYNVDEHFCVDVCYSYTEVGAILYKTREDAQYIVDNYSQELKEFMI